VRAGIPKEVLRKVLHRSNNNNNNPTQTTMNYLGGFGGGNGGSKTESSPNAEGHSPFEAQAFFIRTSGAGNMDSWPDVLTVRGVTSNEKACPSSTGVRDTDKTTTPSEIKLHARRDKPCCYISTDAWSVTDETVLELCDGEDAWVRFSLEPVANGESQASPSWTLECRKQERPEDDDIPRWDMDIEISVVGKSGDVPTFLSKTWRATRRISSRSSSLETLQEEEVLLSTGGFAERFEETYRALGGTGSLNDEPGDLTWFNAGLRIGVGVGLGVCLGAGLGAGILMRSYTKIKSKLY